MENKAVEDVEKKKVEFEKDFLAFKSENNLLREGTKDLEFDLKKTKGDYLELSSGKPVQ